MTPAETVARIEALPKGLLDVLADAHEIGRRHRCKTFVYQTESGGFVFNCHQYDSVCGTLVHRFDMRPDSEKVVHTPPPER